MTMHSITNMTSHKRKHDTEDKEEGPAEKKLGTEVWKACTDEDGKELPLEASSLGRIRNPRSAKVLAAARDARGRRILTFNLIGYGVSRLFCRAFHGAAPTKKHQVRHLDADPWNDEETNLEWATRAQINARADHSKHGNRVGVISEAKDGTTHEYPSVLEAARQRGISADAIRDCVHGRTSMAGGLTWSRSTQAENEEDIPGEEWKSLSSMGFSAYSVSNMGRVRSAVLRRLLKPVGDGRSYPRVQLIGDDKKRRPKAVHVLVARMFLPPPADPNMQIDHINAKRDDPRASNLRFVTARENITFALGRPILRIDDEKKETRYPSVNAAARALVGEDNVKAVYSVNSQIGTAIRNGWKCRGYTWRYVENEQEEKQ